MLRWFRLIMFNIVNWDSDQVTKQEKGPILNLTVPTGIGKSIVPLPVRGAIAILPFILDGS